MQFPNRFYIVVFSPAGRSRVHSDVILAIGRNKTILRIDATAEIARRREADPDLHVRKHSIYHWILSSPNRQHNGEVAIVEYRDTRKLYQLGFACMFDMLDALARGEDLAGEHPTILRARELAAVVGYGDGRASNRLPK